MKNHAALGFKEVAEVDDDAVCRSPVGRCWTETHPRSRVAGLKPIHDQDDHGKGQVVFHCMHHCMQQPARPAQPCRASAVVRGVSGSGGGIKKYRNMLGSELFPVKARMIDKSVDGWSATKRRFERTGVMLLIHVTTM